MKKYWLLILITIIVFLVGFIVLINFSDARASSIGSVAGACGGILAVVWFFAALKSQAKQLENQKEQFLAEFQTLREGARREALMFARDILKDAEGKALKQNPELNAISDLFTNYIDFSSLGVILKSSDPHEVLEQFKVWAKIEGPAITMMRGIKSAAEIYFRAMDFKDIDSSREPEDFVFIYSPLIEKLPYFDTYIGSLRLLTDFMLKLQPGRKAASLAVQVALAKASEVPMKEDKIREEIKIRKESGLSIPNIAKDF